MAIHEFKRLSDALNVSIKLRNSICDPWPTRSKLGRNQAGSQEEFDVLLGSNFSGLEHYTEWKRVA